MGDESEGDDTEKLYQSVFMSKNPLTKVQKSVYAVSFHFDSTVKTERIDYDELLKILSSPETSPEKKRFISFRLGVAKQLELNQVT